MARKASNKRTVHLTNRALRDIASIESYSLEKFGERVTAQYIGKLEAGIVRISENAELLGEEPHFHELISFTESTNICLYAKRDSRTRSSS